MSKYKQKENDGYILANTKCIKCDSDNVYYNINEEKDYYICRDCGAEFNDHKRLGKSFSNAFQLSLTGKALKVAIFLIVFLGVMGYFVPRYIRQKVAEDNAEKMSCVGLSTMSFSQIKKDANNNLELNSIKNVSFICDKVENKIDELKDKKIDNIIMDPPRSGSDKKSLASILEIEPKQIIYISCNPVTLSRDYNTLQEKYNIKEITLFDMFPNTYHIESLMVLERKN